MIKPLSTFAKFNLINLQFNLSKVSILFLIFYIIKIKKNPLFSTVFEKIKNLKDEIKKKITLELATQQRSNLNIQI